MVIGNQSDQIDLTIPTNCENVYTVLDQLLKMQHQDQDDRRVGGGSGGDDASSNGSDLLGISSGVESTHEDTDGQSEERKSEGGKVLPEQSAQWF